MPALTITPATQTAAITVQTGPFTVSRDTNTGAITVTLLDGGAGGTFFVGGSPVTSLSLPFSVGSAQFTYSNPVIGTYPITASAASYSTGTASAIVTAAIPPAPTGFTLTPASCSARINMPAGAYVIGLTNGGVPAVAGVGGVAFTLTSSDLSGSFAPGATVTVPAGQSSVSFTYLSPNTGVATLTASAVGAPYIVNTATAQAAISLPGGTGSGGTMGPIIKANGMEFGEAYLVGTLTTPDDTPFAKLQSLDHKIATGLKEAMGPEQYSAVAVGIGDRKYTGDMTSLAYSLQRFQLLLGGSAPATVAAIVDPVAAPVLTAGAGATTFTAGFVGVAYAYRSKYGTSKISPIATVSVTSTQQIAVTTLGALPTGVLSVDWYVTAQSYTTAPLAAAAALYKSVNNPGTAWTIIAYGLATAAPIPAVSQILSAGSSFSHLAYDEPVPFNIHCVNPLDGSGRNMIIYGNVCSDLANSLKLRDWTSEKITFNTYGDNSVSPARIFDWYAPTTYLV